MQHARRVLYARYIARGSSHRRDFDFINNELDQIAKLRVNITNEETYGRARRIQRACPRKRKGDPSRRSLLRGVLSSRRFTAVLFTRSRARVSSKHDPDPRSQRCSLIVRWDQSAADRVPSLGGGAAFAVRLASQLTSSSRRPGFVSMHLAAVRKTMTRADQAGINIAKGDHPPPRDSLCANLADSTTAKRAGHCCQSMIIATRSAQYRISRDPLLSFSVSLRLRSKLPVAPRASPRG